MASNLENKQDKPRFFANLRRLFGEGSKTPKHPTAEEAIASWENDKERNPAGHKIVRGVDGKPVEVVLIRGGKEAIFAFLVNGEKQDQFQIGGQMRSLEQALGNLTLTQFINDNVFNGWYELIGIQRLDAQVSKAHQGFVRGLPGTKPDRFKVNFSVM